jgi:hypothetical protein
MPFSVKCAETTNRHRDQGQANQDHTGHAELEEAFPPSASRFGIQFGQTRSKERTGPGSRRELPVKISVMSANKTRNRRLNILHPGTALPACFEMSVYLDGSLRGKLAIA